MGLHRQCLLMGLASQETNVMIDSQGGPIVPEETWATLLGVLVTQPLVMEQEESPPEVRLP